MNKEARRDPINDGRKNEKKRGNHSTESIRQVRYAKGIYFGRGSVKRAATFCKRQRRARQSDYSGLFRSPCEIIRCSRSAVRGADVCKRWPRVLQSRGQSKCPLHIAPAG